MKADQLAEAATLGSLLLDPGELEPISHWLIPGDFADPWHADVYHVMWERSAAGKGIGAEGVTRDLRDRAGQRRGDAVRVVDLVSAAPLRPQPRRYGAMVLESSLRREIAGQGVLLRAGALSASLTSTSRPVTSVSAMIEATLLSEENRWRRATGQAPAPVPVALADVQPVLRNRERAWGADRLLAAHPGPDQREVRENEQQLVAGLILHPDRVPAAARWLTPDTLTDRNWRAAYSALVDLVDRGDPVDVVTLAWEIQHASRRRGPGPDIPDLVKAVDGALARDPGYLAVTVAGDLVRRTADSAARALHAASANPGLDVADLFETGRLLTGTVRYAAAGLPDRAGEAVPRRHLHPVRPDLAPVGSGSNAGPVAG